MKDVLNGVKTSINRRSFVKNGLTAASAATMGVGLLASSSSALAKNGGEEHSGSLTKGDAAILRFLAAAEILETDLWQHTTNWRNPGQRSTRREWEFSLHRRPGSS